jgi:acyl carrier protein
MEVDSRTCKTVHTHQSDEALESSDDPITSTDASDVDDLNFGDLNFDDDVLDQDSLMLGEIIQELEEQLGAENQAEIWKLRTYQSFCEFATDIKAQETICSPKKTATTSERSNSR